MNRIAVLSNAGSGGNRRRTELLRLLTTTSDVDHIVTNEVDEISQALTTLLSREPMLLAVNGGDGTVCAVLSHWARLVDARVLPASQLPVVVLPAGSTNMTAQDLGCGGAMRKRVDDLLALRDRDRNSWHVEWRTPLRIVAGDRYHLGFFFGMGTIVRGIEYWHGRMRHGEVGEWSAGVALARAAWGLVHRQPPFHAPVRILLRTRAEQAAGCLETEQVVDFLFATTLRRLLLGSTPFWGEATAPLALTWVEAGARHFLRRLPALLAGRSARLAPEDGYHGLRTEQIELAFDEPWVLDGEVFSAAARLTLAAASAQPFVRLTGVRALPGTSA